MAPVRSRDPEADGSTVSVERDVRQALAVGGEDRGGCIAEDLLRLGPVRIDDVRRR